LLSQRVGNYCSIGAPDQNVQNRGASLVGANIASIHGHSLLYPEIQRAHAEQTTESLSRDRMEKKLTESEINTFSAGTGALLPGG
jgi:hypothetical protein